MSFGMITETLNREREAALKEGGEAAVRKVNASQRGMAIGGAIGAYTGMAIGTAILPGVGTLIGILVGHAIGTANGMKDETATDNVNRAAGFVAGEFVVGNGTNSKGPQP